jgi:hypothetical protein
LHAASAMEPACEHDTRGKSCVKEVFSGLRGWATGVVLVDEATFAKILVRFNNALPILRRLPTFTRYFTGIDFFGSRISFFSVILLMSRPGPRLGIPFGLSIAREVLVMGQQQLQLGRVFAGYRRIWAWQELGV